MHLGKQRFKDVESLSEQVIFLVYIHFRAISKCDFRSPILYIQPYLFLHF